jgi:hypothetical protein
VSWTADAAASDASDADFSIVEPAVTVTLPNTAVSWRIGSARTLRAAHNLGAGQPIAFDVSRDGGQTWEPIATATTTASSTVSLPWVVTGPPTSAARVRARWLAGAGTADASDVDFRILSRITVTSPNTAVTWGAGSTRQVSWTHNLDPAEAVNIDLSVDGGQSWTPLAAGVIGQTSTTGSVNLPIVGSPSPGALVRVSQASDPSAFDVSDVPFTLAAPAIVVTSPNSGVSWTIGSARTIAWTHNLGTAERVHVTLSRDDGLTWEPLAASLANAAGTRGTFSWIVTGPPTQTGRIRVQWLSDPGVGDVSDVPFRIPD